MSKNIRLFRFVLVALGIAAIDSGAQAGTIITVPWLQDVYTNRVTVMCETLGEMPGLSVQMAKPAQTVEMTAVSGLKEGTFIYKAQVSLTPGEEHTYRLSTNGVEITSGSVTAWKDGDAAFSCAIWGDNQEGVQGYDWGNDETDERYRCIRSMFSHMAGLKPDFGFTTGDLSSGALYDEEIEPGELRGTDDLFGRTIPYHLVWGNHDCNYQDVQRYFSPAATEEDGWFYVYRNDVLFIGVHWVWGRGDAETKHAAIVAEIEKLLATDRAKNAKFRVLMQHAPIFLEVWNVLPKSNWFSDTRLLDVAKAGGVDVVFSGHTHAYERIERDGLVQIVNGGMGYLDHGERWYNNYGSDTKVGGHRNTPLLWSRQDSSSLITHHSSLAPAQPVRMGCFQSCGLLSVTNDTLTYKAYAFDANGSYIGVADSFTLRSKTRPSPEAEAETVMPFVPKVKLSAPVNNENWKEYMDFLGVSWKKPSGQADSDPVCNVSKTEIERYCAALNAGESGANYRLPTEKELTADFEGDLERDISEWTSDVDPSTGWCRILCGNKTAVDYTWCRAADKPAMPTPDCHAKYLGFRVINEKLSGNKTWMDRALEDLAKISKPCEVYMWDPDAEALTDISKDWTAGGLSTEYNYWGPVIFTGTGALAYSVSKDITFKEGVAAPNATSLDFSHKLGNGNKVTVKGEFRGGVTADEWRFFLKCDKLTLENVTYRGQVFNAVTDDRTLNLVGDNDFSGAVMSLCVDKVLEDPQEDFVTNLVAEAAATLALRRLDFSARGVVEEVLGQKTAGFTVGENVTLTTAEDVLFGIKGATLTVDGTLDAAGVDMAGHLLGLLPQEATVDGAGTVKTTHFGMCDKSTLYVGVSNVTLLSSAPYRTYTDCVSTCNVVRLDGAVPTVERLRDHLVSTNGIANVKEIAQTIKSKHKSTTGLQEKLIDTQLAADPLTGAFYVPKSASSVEVEYSLPADSDKRFADGSRVKTFKMTLDESVGTWQLTKAIDPTTDLAAGKPTVKLGVVAQRYPWNVKVDIEYRASYVQTGAAATLAVTANGKTVMKDVKLVNGVNALEFDAKEAFGEIKAEGVKVELKLK